VTIDQYASTRQENVLVYQSPGLVYGAHTVSVTVAGTHQSASTGNVVAVDRAVVSTPPQATANDAVLGTTPGTFSYAGTWTTSTGVGKYLGDDHYSLTTGSNYTFRFSGTQVALYGAKASHHGQASVRIDGGAAVTIDQYASARQENVLVYQSPVLASGAHTVNVSVKGTRNSASTGYVISVDRAVSTG
jgi:mannan endo-1,4-beta-mannosidase